MALILHVDDDAIMCEVVKEVLEKAGHEVVYCTTITTAKVHLDHTKFDLVIVEKSIDVKADGFILASVLQLVGKLVLILSGQPPSGQFPTLKNVDFFSKTTFIENPDELVKKVNEILNRKK